MKVSSDLGKSLGGWTEFTGFGNFKLQEAQTTALVDGEWQLIYDNYCRRKRPAATLYEVFPISAAANV